MSFAVGLQVLKKLCESQDKLAWLRAKLTPRLFQSDEMAIYDWTASHLNQYHALPSLLTLQSMFSETAQLETPEPANYYLQKLENRFSYNRLTGSMQAAYDILKNNHDDHEKARKVLRDADRDIGLQKYRHRILDIGEECPQMILNDYHNGAMVEHVSLFGWPYMDHQSGGVMPGEVVSFVGRPNLGKTWMLVSTALQNWKAGVNTLFVSMEMRPLDIARRLASIYTGLSINQWKNVGLPTATYKKFADTLCLMSDEKAKFYVVDGNLAPTVDDIYGLADVHGSSNIVIDGGYLVRHANPRLDRFTRAAENIELMKRFTTDIEAATFTSWQLNREGSKKISKTSGEDVGLEDIGHSDAIGQISSTVLGLFKEHGIDTERKIRVLKGRNGETGEFTINWDFNNMDFTQLDPPLEDTEHENNHEAQWV